MSPNAKDTLLIKNKEGEKVPVRKILTQVGLGTIFLNIVRENPTIKHKVGKCAFQYIINQLGCVRRFTDSYKTMCRCTECIGLHTLYQSLQAKRGGVRRHIAIDLGQRRTKVHAQAMARGWGDVTLHPTPRDAIIDGLCERWSSHAVPHWECQMLQCGACKAPPVPEEEAREDAGTEEISFHVYEYKVSKRLDRKERRRLKLVQKHTSIGEFHHVFYGPKLSRARYRHTSYMLAVQCCGERRKITRRCVSSHRDYGERMALSFNKEIQLGYY